MNPKLKKALILFSLLLLPTILYLTLTTGKHNFVNLPHLVKESGDTAKIPPFSFINQDGKIITNADYKGKIYVADFFFTTCPGICKIMTGNMLRLQEEFKNNKDFALLSHTVNPEKDTVETLRRYARDKGADTRNWNFVTGTKDSIYKIAESYFANVMADSLALGGFLHSEFFILVDKEGNIRCRKEDDGNIKAVYDGTSETDMRKLKDDIKVLIAEYNLALKKNNNATSKITKNNE
jgi:protein SCO1/2